MGEAIGIVDILRAGEPSESRLTEQPCQQMPGILAATFHERVPCVVGQPERGIQFTIRKQPAVHSIPTNWPASARVSPSSTCAIA